MTRTKHLLGAAALAAGLALAQPAGAAVISYVEGPSSVPVDLSSAAGVPTDLGPLDIGLNTVTGGISCSGSGCDAGDPEDRFSVILAAGLRITGITIKVDAFTSNSIGGRFLAVAGPDNVGAALDAATGNFSQGFSSNLAEQSVFSGAADGPGTLVLLVGSNARTTNTVTTSFGYVVGITVEAIPTTAVPEPATLALFGAGLLGLAATRRRRVPLG